MSSFSPAVQRYLNSCRTNNIQGVRAYLTTIHCNPHWAYRGLEYCVGNRSLTALRLLCDYKKKINTDHDQEWTRLSTDALRRLLNTDTSNSESKEVVSILLQTHPQPDLNALAGSIGECGNLSILEVSLPYLSTQQKRTMFERACKTRNSTECVERMLYEVDVETVWPQIADSWDKPNQENATVVENFLLNKKMMAEIQTNEKTSVSRRKM